VETLIAAVILLGILIFVHELGHFLVAKRTGVKVEKFSLGFGTKILSKKIGETEYLLSAIPLGGYVKMIGEDPNEEVAEPERSFSNKSVWVRLSIVIAGPLFNILFAILMLSMVFMAGVRIPSDKALVGKIKEGYPAQKVGLRAGDAILQIDGVKVATWVEMADIIHEAPGRELNLQVKRGDQLFPITITPVPEVIKNLLGKEKNVGLIGIQPKMVTERYGPIKSVYFGFVKTWEITYITFWAIHKMIIGQISTKNLGGPILIVQKAGEFASEGFSAYVGFAAIISINLGILNLLPIPILDGGHILFFLMEIIFRKPLSLKIRERAQQVGLFMLITLMVFAFFNDFLMFFEQ